MPAFVNRFYHSRNIALIRNGLGRAFLYSFSVILFMSSSNVRKSKRGNAKTLRSKHAEVRTKSTKPRHADSRLKSSNVQGGKNFLDRIAFALFWFAGILFIALGLLPLADIKVMVGGVSMVFVAGVFFMLAAMAVYAFRRQSFNA